METSHMDERYVVVIVCILLVLFFTEQGGVE